MVNATLLKLKKVHRRGALEAGQITDWEVRAQVGDALDVNWNVTTLQERRRERPRSGEMSPTDETQRDRARDDAVRVSEVDLDGLLRRLLRTRQASTATRLRHHLDEKISQLARVSHTQTKGQSQCQTEPSPTREQRSVGDGLSQNGSVLLVRLLGEPGGTRLFSFFVCLLGERESGETSGHPSFFGLGTEKKPIWGTLLSSRLKSESKNPIGPQVAPNGALKPIGLKRHWPNELLDLKLFG